MQVDNPDINLKDFQTTGGDESLDHGESFFERRNMKTSNMKEYCNLRTYNTLKTKVSAKDFVDRLKITKKSRYITPNESIPFKKIMKKVQDTNPMVPRRQIDEMMIQRSEEVVQSLDNSLENQVMTITGSQDVEDFEG